MTIRAPSRNRFSRPGDRSDVGRKSTSPSRDLRRSTRPRPRAAAGGGQRVRDVVAGEPADRDRDRGRARRSVSTRASPSSSTSPAVADDVAPPAGRDVPPDRRGAAGDEREQRDVAADPAGDRGDERVVGVEHDPAVRLRDPGDGRLDLGQLGQRVDALEVEVVRRDVRDDADARSTRSPCRAGRARRGRSRGRRRRGRSGRGSASAPPGPVQSPGSTIRSSTRTPSDVVVPTRRPARRGCG